MKTLTFKKTFFALALIAGIFFSTTTKACSAHVTYTLGINGQVTFTDSTVHDTSGSSFYWDAGDGRGFGFGSNVFQHTYIANGTYYAYLTTTDSSSCTASDTVKVVITNVTSPCTLAANYSYVVNANGQVTFTSTSSGTNANTFYYWTAGDGSPQVKGGATFSHTYAIQGYYPVELIIEDTGSAYCKDSASTTVGVSTADSNLCGLHPIINYTLGANGYVTFTTPSYGKDSAYSYYNNWFPGDTSGPKLVPNDSAYTHFYTANGTYTVSLIVNINYPYLCSDSVAIPITITNVTIPCTLNASFNAINDTTKGMVNFVSTSTGTYPGTQYYWIPGDGSPAVKAGASYNYTYAANGTYVASLILHDTGTAFCADTMTNGVLVNVSNVDSLHSSFTSFLYDDTIGNYIYNFTSTSTGTNNATMYAWEPGDSTAGDTGVNMTTYTHSYKYAGAHTVTLSVWFSKYPIIAHNGGGGNYKSAVFYQLSTTKMVVYVGSPAGISTISGTGSDFKLYPNPNNGSFRLAIRGIGNNGNAEVQITNLLGEVIYSTTASASNGVLIKDIELPTVSTGTYFVRIITADKVYNTKTVINR